MCIGKMTKAPECLIQSGFEDESEEILEIKSLPNKEVRNKQLPLP